MVWKEITMIIEKEENIDISYLNVNLSENIVATRWEISGQCNKRKEYLEYMVNQLYIFSKKIRFKLVVAVGDDDFNESTRIINYYKLWKSLSKYNLNVINGKYSEEISLKKDTMIRFFGGIELLEEQSVSGCVDVILTRMTSHLLLLPSNLSVEEIIKSGFSRDLSENSSYISNVVNQGGVVLFREGYFDDINTGFIGFGPERLMNQTLFGN